VSVGRRSLPPREDTMRGTARVLAALALLGGCHDGQIPSETTQSQLPAAANQALGASVHQDLATLRRVTASFHQFARAAAAGWSAPITPCMTDPDGAGGMGFHYGNVGLIDGSVSVAEPELLLYEPERNGRLRLVAVEYIIPYGFHARDAAAPVLFGQEFTRNDVFQLWGLHAWVWKKNPSGMFANWNPKVTCEHATATMAMTH
ncbi:MAG: hypothetical protein ABI785_09510, partial [Gemmatimonadales bacterium]